MSAQSRINRRFVRLFLALAASFIVLALVPSIQVTAGSGDLDLSFGVGGKVITPIGASDRAEALAIQPDGKILAAGGSASRGIGYANDFALVRYDISGHLDKSFGTDGIIRTDFFGDEDFIRAIALQTDGKIVVAGQARQELNIYFGLARYNTDGSLDATFGTGGKVITSIASNVQRAHTLVIQPDGRIVVGGYTIVATNTIPVNYNFDFALARYNTDGSLDTSFGTDGKVISAFDGQINKLVLQPDGRIIAGGIITTTATDTDFALARYNSDGSLDKSFGKNGKVSMDFYLGADFIEDIALQADGKIVVGGDIESSHSIHSSSYFGLARYNPDGSLDNTFGSDGKVITAGNFIGARAIAVQSNGKIIAAGFAYNQETGGDFGLVRYTAKGSLDPGFGSGGKITTNISESDSAFALLLLPDNRILVAGATSTPTTGSGFALARYNNTDDRFDMHLQGDNSGCVLRLNSTTGEYLFTDCDSGYSLAGTAALRVRGCKIFIEDTGADYILSAKVNSCALTGKTSLQVQSQGRTFAIKDQDINSTLSICH